MTSAFIALEDLQSGLVEIEAFAHAARALVDSLPRLPWPDDRHGLDTRLIYDRMSVLVEAVADAARRARATCHGRLRELAAEPRPDRAACALRGRGASPRPGRRRPGGGESESFRCCQVPSRHRADKHFDSFLDLLGVSDAGRQFLDDGRILPQDFNDNCGHAVCECSVVRHAQTIAAGSDARRRARRAPGKRFSNERIEVDLATGAVTVDQQASNVRVPLALPDAGYPLYRDGRFGSQDCAGWTAASSSRSTAMHCSRITGRQGSGQRRGRIAQLEGHCLSCSLYSPEERRAAPSLRTYGSAS